MRVPPLLKLIGELFTWRQLLVNRFTLLLAIVLVMTGGVVAYVDQNDGGQIAGKVVIESGEPVPNATVELHAIPLQGVVKTNTTNTNAEGAFEFTGKESLLEYRLVVRVDGTTVHKKHYHLMFKGQNRDHTITVETET